MTDLAIPQFHEVVQSVYAELRHFALRKLGNPANAEDVVQEAYLRLGGLDARTLENPRAYLYRIVGNLVIDHRRRERVHAARIEDSERAVEAADPSADAERRLISKQRLALLARAVDELPPRCRECFRLRRFEDLSQDEIASRMGISRNMVEKHLRLALAHCAKRLREGD